MTRKRQRLTDEQRAIIKNGYLAGQKPAALAERIGANVATVRQAIWRNGHTKEREEIKEAAARTAQEVWQDAQKRHAERLAGIMDNQIESLVIDSERLRDGWDLVEDAAGASALERSKSLLQNRTLRHFGLSDNRSDAPAGNTMNLFLLAEPSRKHVEPASADVTPEPAQPSVLGA